MTLVNAFSDSTPGGTAGTPKTGDLSSAITAGSTGADIRITNTGGDVCTLNWRDTGTSTYYKIQLSPETSQDIKIALTAARTFEYHFDAGALRVDVVYFFGTGLTSTVSLADVTKWIEMLGYTVSATGNLTSAEVQLLLDDISTDVAVYAEIFNRIAMYPVNPAIKNRTILKGSVAEALFVIRNIGTSSGLSQDRLLMAETTANQYQVEYEKKIKDMENGLNIGA